MKKYKAIRVERFDFGYMCRCAINGTPLALYYGEHSRELAERFKADYEIKPRFRMTDGGRLIDATIGYELASGDIYTEREMASIIDALNTIEW